MTHPTDAAIAQAFRETNTGLDSALDFAGKVVRRARELDAEKGGEELAEGEYAISSVKDLFAVPVELRDVCLRELAYGLALHELAYGERAAETLNRIVWRNDGKREYDLSDANGNQVLCMNITDSTPPAQAAEAAVSVDRLVPSNCRERLRLEGKPYPRSSCQACGKFSPKSSQCDALLAGIAAAAPAQPEGENHDRR